MTESGFLFVDGVNGADEEHDVDDVLGEDTAGDVAGAEGVKNSV